MHDLIRPRMHWGACAAGLMLLLGIAGAGWAQNTGIAQTNAVSPYSAFGVGDLSDQALSRNYGMGSVGIATFDRLNVNRLNPANLSDLIFTSVDATFNYRLNTLRTNTSGAYFRDGGLSGLSFAFPTRSKLVLAVGVSPLSAVGYDVNSVRTVSDGVTTQLYTTRTLADGGLSEVSLSGARRFWKNRLAVGLTANYAFGTIEELIQTNVLGGAIANFQVTTQLAGVNLSLGTTYTDTLRSSNEYYRVGLVLKTPTSLRASERTIGSGSVTLPSVLSDTSGTVRLPFEIGFGLGYERSSQWSVALDVRYADWSGFEFLGRQQTLDGRLRVNAGVEWIPTFNSRQYFKRMAYRAGARYENTYLNLNGQTVNNFSFTMGLGLPLERNYSLVNLGVTYGQRGTLDAGLIRENYFQFVIGLNFNELWFVKRRYD